MLSIKFNRTFILLPKKRGWGVGVGGDDTLSVYNINEPGAEGEENVDDSAAKYHW